MQRRQSFLKPSPAPHDRYPSSHFCVAHTSDITLPIFAAIMHSRPLLLVAAAITFSGNAIAGRAQDVRSNKALLADILSRRQSDDFPYNETSICLSYGIDYQNGGSYFIDSRSMESFTVVSQFDNCEPDTTAYVLLVNDDTGDQLECSGVTTTPDLTNVISTCPITKSQMTSGAWSILVIGNNGGGSPYAWQRDFTLTVGVPSIFNSILLEVSQLIFVQPPRLPPRLLRSLRQQPHHSR